jgi:hypothetical protein
MDETTGVTLAGRALHCLHCGHDRFYHRRTAMETLYLGGLIRGGAHGDLYLCGRCGHTQVFLPVPEGGAEVEGKGNQDSASAIAEFLEASREADREDQNPGR